MNDTGHVLTELPSGVRVVTEAMPSVRSIALGIFVGVGSRDESDAQQGISHFIEHLLFKGTRRFGSTEIDEIFDAMGAEMNAGTSKETTTLYARFLDRHLERALEVMGDMVLRPAWADIDSERQVVIEEIAMYEDEPSDKVHDVLAGAVFGDHPLGRPIIGTPEVVGSVSVDDLAAYHGRRYNPDRLVVAAAGNLHHDHVVTLVEGALAGGGPPPGEALAAANGALGPRAPELRFHRKETEQVHLCLGGTGISRGDERRFALRVLDTVLGGSSSSRLFQEVRERRGLAYSVFSYFSQFTDTGEVALYVGTRPDRVAEALEVVAAELHRLQDESIPESELDRARENVKGRTALSLESTSARMSRLGSSILTGVPVLSPDEIMARIDAVTADDLTALARDLFAPERLSAAGVGADEDAFRAALTPLSPQLAAA
ncbi:MAG: FIG007959: peptidase, M16 family [uncultured Solirubrobacterales bacterium]|uniref:FIG007959: peptidase, M16 family n=1 Tax=uncultured Solirubrobacterales bacterium TaxID=768556 RepID=A0A6J4SQX2_9ACTN|nr:MAG: FIG007959: peptidase, M16 family [uncultured Solirubrobacterales bacterium]